MSIPQLSLNLDECRARQKRLCELMPELGIDRRRGGFGRQYAVPHRFSTASVDGGCGSARCGRPFASSPLRIPCQIIVLWTK